MELAHKGNNNNRQSSKFILVLDYDVLLAYVKYALLDELRRKQQVLHLLLLKY